ncbi:MAG: methyltransferase [Candidatus Brocadiae bacterium]|nr:methyltransferase [Candidatus Brocadiia bacterium]
MRPAASIKMGFYPTPSTVVNKIKTFLQFPQGKVSFFDPCCGEGIAVKELAEGKNAVTYGIELDQARAEAAKQNLDFVISGDFFQTKISNNAFSLMLNNPPYFSDGIERQELAFLRNTIRYLQPQGILIFIISQHRLDEKIAKVLSLHFENIQVFAFPQDEYEAFKQIVILGSKKQSSEPDLPKLQELLRIPDSMVAEIPETPLLSYPVPETQLITIFKSSVVDVLELQKFLAKSTLWNRLENSHRKLYGSNRPPLPLRTGHLALVLASGYLDGEVGEGGNLHIVKGRVFKETKENTEVLDKELIHRETDVIRISIKILKADGSIQVLV